jgi:drug/metabolite transporter (DMT)-like permease
VANKPRAADAALAAGFVVMWSSGFIGARLGTDAAGTVTLLMWRFVLVAALLLAWSRLRGSRLSRREVALQAVIGLLSQGVYLAGTVLSIELGVALGTAALIAALQPILAGALAGPVLGERVAVRQWAGLGLGVAGVGLVVGGDVQVHGAPAWAYALPFAGMAGLVAATLIERRAAPETDLMDGLAIQCAVSAGLFSAIGLLAGDAAPPADAGFWLAVAWVIVLSTIGGYGLYWLNLQRGSVTRVSSLIYLTPPTTMVWAFLMFGETIGVVAAGGLVVCLGAVLLVRSGG